MTDLMTVVMVVILTVQLEQPQASPAQEGPQVQLMFVLITWVLMPRINHPLFRFRSMLTQIDMELFSRRSLSLHGLLMLEEQVFLSEISL